MSVAAGIKRKLLNVYVARRKRLLAASISNGSSNQAGGYCDGMWRPRRKQQMTAQWRNGVASGRPAA